jgi:glycosidase
MATEFTTADWAKHTNVYEVNIRQYTAEGTFHAFQKHLPRLQKMGVEILWLMPVTPISVERRKGSLGSYYATASYTHINPEFGTNEDFRILIQEAHDRGMKLIIDWVANHTGADHEWVTKHPEFYKKDEGGNFAIMHGWDDVYHLDYSHPGIAERLIEDMQYWIREFDIDGFRCDMAHLVPLDFWRAARTQCEDLKKLYWLAECDEPEYSAVFDTTYAWEWMHASKGKVHGQNSLNDLKQLLNKYLQMPNGALKLLFTSNHDENSWNGTEYERYGDGAKMLAVFSALFKGVPLIYTGQEKPNYKRIEFFEKDEFNWNGDIALHDFYKRLLSIRKKHNAFNHDQYSFVQTTNDDAVLAFICGNENENIITVLNFSPNEIPVNVEDGRLSGKYRYLFTDVETELNGNYYSVLPPFSFNVVGTVAGWTD